MEMTKKCKKNLNLQIYHVNRKTTMGMIIMDMTTMDMITMDMITMDMTMDMITGIIIKV